MTKLKPTKIEFGWYFRGWANKWSWKPNFQHEMFSNNTIEMWQFRWAWFCVALTKGVK